MVQCGLAREKRGGKGPNVPLTTTEGGRLPPVVVVPGVGGDVVVWRQATSSDERALFEFQTPTEKAGQERDLGNTFALATNALVAQWS